MEADFIFLAELFLRSSLKLVVLWLVLDWEMEETWSSWALLVVKMRGPDSILPV